MRRARSRSSSRRASSRSSSGPSFTTSAAPAALQQLRALAEIAHVRAHEHRLAAHRGLQHVVPADRHEAAADEDDLGERVEGGQLAHGVEDDDRAGSRRAAGGGCAGPRPRPRSRISSSTSPARSGWRGASSRARSGQRVRARRKASRTTASSPRCVLPAIQSRASAPRREPLAPGGGVVAGRLGHQVALQIAGHHHARRRRAERDDPPRVLLGLHREDGDVREHAPHQPADPPVAAERPVGDAAVGDHGRDAGAARARAGSWARARSRCAMKKRGRAASSARRTGPGRSIGK